ncbi:hypothetical protein XENOCAPTIV_003358 [Xenoophorus captivus]|uniref:Uncharacterized protein n=1 Tax=Xenoophorus captivus TaxID=1517983 RepID=A0ABV0RWL1_9TELE
MTKAAVTKLLLLVILAFIICLPEYFRIYSVSKVNFLCLPHLPSEQRYQERKAGNGRPRNGENERKSLCDPTPTPEHEQWEQICTQKTQRNTRGDSSRGWFVCKTDKNMEDFNSNISSKALMVFLEVSVSFQLNDTETMNLTLYGHSNHSFLYLQIPEEVGDQDEGDVFLSSPCGNNERQGNKSGFFYFTSNSQFSLDSFLKSSVFPLPLHCLIFPRPHYILRLCISGIDFGYPSSCFAL